jgi:hypothetical protein
MRSSSTGSLRTPGTAGGHAERQAAVEGLRFEIHAQSVEQRSNGYVRYFRFHLAGIDLGNIEQFVEQTFERFDGTADAGHQIGNIRFTRLGGERCGEQAHRVQGLAQVVTGCREELALCATRLVCTIARLRQFDVLILQSSAQHFVGITAAQRSFDQRVEIATHLQQCEHQYGDDEGDQQVIGTRPPRHSVR